MHRSIAAIALSLMFGCEDGGVPPQQPEQVIRAPGVEPGELTRYDEGRTVRVAGDVEQVLDDDRAFVIDGGGLLSDDDLVVVAKMPVMLAGLPLDEDDEVVVTGTVRIGVAAAERALGRKLDPAIARVIRDGPVVIAREVRRAGTASGWINPDSELAP